MSLPKPSAQSIAPDGVPNEHTGSVVSDFYSTQYFNAATAYFEARHLFRMARQNPNHSEESILLAEELMHAEEVLNSLSKELYRFVTPAHAEFFLQRSRANAKSYVQRAYGIAEI